MPRFIICIAFVVLATVCLLAGRASAAAGNLCSNSGFYTDIPDVNNAVWRMEVSEDEAAYTGPSIHDRIAHNWNDEAKRTYRWTSAVMPFDNGTSTQLMAVSAAVIGGDVPLLEKGDIVDVAVLSQGLDYRKGRAPAILQRVCSAQDKPCLDRLRKSQEGMVSGVEIKGGYPVAGHRRFSPPFANLTCSAPKDRCRGEMASTSQ